MMTETRLPSHGTHDSRTADPLLRHPILVPDLPVPEITETTYKYIDTRTMDWVTLVKHAETGQWKHPFKNMAICGGRNATYNVADVIDPAASPICMQPAGSKTAHLGVGTCSRHGGNLPGHNVRGVRTLESIRIRSQLSMLGVPLEVKPTDALLHLVSEAAGNVAFLGGRVADLGFDLVGPIYSLTREGVPVETSEEIRAMVRLYNDERDRLAKMAKLAIDAGIAEREVRVLEEQAVMMATVFKNVLASLPLTPELRAQATQMLGRELRQLDTVVTGSYAVVTK